MKLIALRLPVRPQMKLVTARLTEPWGDAPDTEWLARRCLPLRLASQNGWLILNPLPFVARWNGGPGVGDVDIRPTYDTGPMPPAFSNFGAGIITWRLPYLFRTPPGWNLLARGPANLPKPGAWPLEGLVETDWAPQTFTMNWQLEQDRTVTFEEDEPFCMIVPQERGRLEGFDPVIQDVQEDPEEWAGFAAFKASRDLFHREVHSGARPALDWQKHYFHGESPGGKKAPPDHQTRLFPRPFKES